MRLFSFLLLSLVMMIFLASAILVLIGFKPLSNVYWLALSTPILWLGAMFYSYWDDKAWRPPVVLSVIILVSIIIIIMNPISQV